MVSTTSMKFKVNIIIITVVVFDDVVIVDDKFYK